MIRRKRQPMKPLLGFVLLLTALSTSAAGADPARKPAKESAPESAKRAANAKRILLITGEDYQRRKKSRMKGHVWQETAPALRDELRKDARLEVDIVDDLKLLRSQDLSKYAAVVMHFKNYGRKVLAGPPAAERAKPVRIGQWNDHRIRCEGPRIQIWRYE